jgi:GAF domain-containing protein
MMSDTHAEKDDALSGTLRILNVRSVMCVPLIAGSKPVGAIYVDSITQPFGFRRDDLSLLTAMSSRLALALETTSIKSKKGKG